MAEGIRHPWTVGVSSRSTVLYALPWRQVADAWILERIYDGEVTVYLADEGLPRPPGAGTAVDPGALGWEAVARHPPHCMPA